MPHVAVLMWNFIVALLCIPYKVHAFAKKNCILWWFCEKTGKNYTPYVPLAGGGRLVGRLMKFFSVCKQGANTPCSPPLASAVWTSPWPCCELLQRFHHCVYRTLQGGYVVYIHGCQHARSLVHLGVCRDEGLCAHLDRGVHAYPAP